MPTCTIKYGVALSLLLVCSGLHWHEADIIFQLPDAIDDLQQDVTNTGNLLAVSNNAIYQITSNGTHYEPLLTIGNHSCNDTSQIQYGHQSQVSLCRSENSAPSFLQLTCSGNCTFLVIINDPLNQKWKVWARTKLSNGSFDGTVQEYSDFFRHPSVTLRSQSKWPTKIYKGLQGRVWHLDPRVQSGISYTTFGSYPNSVEVPYMHKGGFMPVDVLELTPEEAHSIRILVAYPHDIYVLTLAMLEQTRSELVVSWNYTDIPCHNNTSLCNERYIRRMITNPLYIENLAKIFVITKDTMKNLYFEIYQIPEKSMVLIPVELLANNQSDALLEDVLPRPLLYADGGFLMVYGNQAMFIDIDIEKHQVDDHSAWFEFGLRIMFENGTVEEVRSGGRWEIPGGITYQPYCISQRPLFMQKFEMLVSGESVAVTRVESESSHSQDYISTEQFSADNINLCTVEIECTGILLSLPGYRMNIHSTVVFNFSYCGSSSTDSDADGSTDAENPATQSDADTGAENSTIQIDSENSTTQIACLHGGSLSLNNSYCLCDYTGYTGDRCESLEAQCPNSLSQCLNGGECLADGECQCAGSYNGRFCERHDDCGTVNPCPQPWQSCQFDGGTTICVESELVLSQKTRSTSCLRNEDCEDNDSECSKGLCVCKLGYVLSDDQLCIPGPVMCQSHYDCTYYNEEGAMYCKDISLVQIGELGTCWCDRDVIADEVTGLCRNETKDVGSGKLTAKQKQVISGMYAFSGMVALVIGVLVVVIFRHYRNRYAEAEQHRYQQPPAEIGSKSIKSEAVVEGETPDDKITENEAKLTAAERWRDAKDKVLATERAGKAERIGEDERVENNEPRKLSVDRGTKAKWEKLVSQARDLDMV